MDAWRELMRALSTSGDSVDRELARSIEKFVAETTSTQSAALERSGPEQVLDAKSTELVARR